MEKVQPGFRAGGRKSCEQFVADMRANGGLALVASRGIVAVQIAADLTSHRQQFVFLGVKALMPLEQDVRQLSGRYVHPHLSKVLQ